MKDIIVFKNAIPNLLFNKVKEDIFSDGFPWFYTSTTLGNVANADKFAYSFFHNAYFHDDGYSYIGQELENAILLALESINQPIEKLLRIRLGLITVTHQNIIHTPHIDFPYEHKTGLLYFNSCDGDTILYNEKYNPNTDKKTHDQIVRRKYNEIITTFTPEENKLVIFDGLLYHCSSSPTTVDRRIVMNFNYI